MVAASRGAARLRRRRAGGRARGHRRGGVADVMAGGGPPGMPPPPGPPHALHCVALTGCEVAAWLGPRVLLVCAVKRSGPTARLAALELNREALLADFGQIGLGLVVTVGVAVNPVLAAFAVPAVLLARPFMMHAQL